MWYPWQVESQALLGHMRCGQAGRRWLDQILCKVSRTREGRKQETQVPLHTPLHWLLSQGIQELLCPCFSLDLIFYCCVLLYLPPVALD